MRMYDEWHADDARAEDEPSAGSPLILPGSGAGWTRRGVISAALGAGISAGSLFSAKLFTEDAEAEVAERQRPDGTIAKKRYRNGDRWDGRPLPLGYLPPQDPNWADAYRLVSAEAPKPGPVVAGFDWYTGFDYPVKRQGLWWIGLGNDWGTIRAGHAVVFRPPSLTDPTAAWTFYNQGNSAACVGYAASRAATLFNRGLYAGDPLYKAAQRYDARPGTNYDGTTIDAGMAALQNTGPWLVKDGKTIGPLKAHGIKSFRMVFTVTDIQTALGTNEDFVRILSSWGALYPREVRMPMTAFARLINSHSQFAVPVDRITGTVA
ncbi:MAG: hypothetical protein ACR2J8_05400 [Thermomicrobiales bacterium]